MLKNPDNQSTNFAFCSNPFTKVILTSWGEVSMCCHQHTQLGKLDEKTDILDIWNNFVAKEIREFTKNGKLHPVCFSWNVCPFITKLKKPFYFESYKNSRFPIFLEICLPDKHCNIGGETPDEDNPACIMCARNFHKPDQPDMTDFLCEKAKSLMPYLRFLSVLGIAEPFWKDAVFRIFEKLDFKKYKNEIEFTTNTNGTCLNEKTSLKFFNSTTKSNISWSLDAADPITFKKIRRLDLYDQVIENLKRWIKMREKFGGKKQHRVSIYNNINMLNVHEMSKMVETAHKLNVEKLTMIPTSDQLGIVKLGDLLLNKKNVDLFKQESEKATSLAKKLGVELEYPKCFDLVPPTVEQLVQLSI